MDEKLFAKAERLKPNLIKETVFPKKFVEIIPDEKGYQGYSAKEIGDYVREDIELKNGSSVILDFGTHYVGYLSFDIDTVSGMADSPAELRFTFGETPYEIMTPPEDYHGTLGSGWLQNETRKIPFLPHSETLCRRYAFRYLKIEMLGSWTGYKVRFSDLFFTAVSSVSAKDVESLPEGTDSSLARIDEISINTLKNCMHDVFEDGPKRDRRLWMGDLRLQALANYATFKNYDLVKRCLYLFTATLIDNKVVPPCLYTNRAPYVDAGPITDYSLLYIACVNDYFEETGDRELAEELFPAVMKQIDYGESVTDNEGMLHGFLLIDWAPVDKNTAGQGVWVYCLKAALSLAKSLNKTDVIPRIEALIEKTSAALLRCRDEKTGFFLSGEKGEFNWVSQVWAVLSGALSKEEACELLNKTEEARPEINMRAPYMYHYYIEALISCDMKAKAEEKIRFYWGGMADKGADCFFEVYDPDNEMESPYKDPVINSNCHAWSCTPTYFIRRFLL